MPENRYRAARTESGGRNFMTVRLPRDVIRQARNTARMQRRRAPGEPGYGEVERPPKEVDGTNLAKKACTEPKENAIDQNERAEEPLYRRGIVGPLLVVLPKWDRIGDFVRAIVEIGRAAKPRYHFTKARIKLRHGHWSERDLHSAAVDRLTADHMAQEIKSDFHANNVRDQ